MAVLAITSMYANPIHPWHIECLDLSKTEAGADELWVIINNDIQAELKRWVKSFQDEQFRMKIVQSLKSVDRVFLSIDKDGSVCESLKYLIQEAKKSLKYSKIFFTKWWDRFASEIPEACLLRNEWIEIIDGLWAKTYNSSDFIKKTKDENDAIDLDKKLSQLPKEITYGRYLEVGNRPWWVYYVLEDLPLYKVKKIIVNPWFRLSLQSHEKRSEHWTVVSWTAVIDIRDPEYWHIEQLKVLRANEGCYIQKWFIHRLSNKSADPLVVIEVQCGEYTGEDDIIRYEDDFGR